LFEWYAEGDGVCVQQFYNIFTQVFNQNIFMWQFNFRRFLIASRVQLFCSENQFLHLKDDVQFELLESKFFDFSFLEGRLFEWYAEGERGGGGGVQLLLPFDSPKVSLDEKTNAIFSY